MMGDRSIGASGRKAWAWVCTGSVHAALVMALLPSSPPTRNVGFANAGSSDRVVSTRQPFPSNGTAASMTIRLLPASQSAASMAAAPATKSATTTATATERARATAPATARAMAAATATATGRAPAPHSSSRDTDRGDDVVHLNSGAPDAQHAAPLKSALSDRVIKPRAAPVAAPGDRPPSFSASSGSESSSAISATAASSLIGAATTATATATATATNISTSTSTSPSPNTGTGTGAGGGTATATATGARTGTGTGSGGAATTGTTTTAGTTFPTSTAALPADHQDCAAQSTARHYPALLRERGIEGRVLLRVKVDEQGRAAEVVVAGGSGWRLLDEAARRVAASCPYLPARRGDERLASWVEYPVRFALRPSHPHAHLQ